jgi:transposase, IS30 family
MSHTQLTEGQRYQIYTLKQNGFNQSNIAHQVGVDPSTICRELTRNTGARGYRPKQAHGKAVLRRQNAEKAKCMTDEIVCQVKAYLQQQWSPEQISGYLRVEGKLSISHEKIYQFILEDKASGGALYKDLRHHKKKRKKRYGAIDRRGQIKDRVSIDSRPASIEKRERIGDWEIDLVLGKNHKGAIVTIVDRLSLMTLIGPVPSKHAKYITAMTSKLLNRYKKHGAKTITSDNGREFSGHKDISRALGIDFYFAHP